MLAIQAILHPTDFSEHSEHAFRLACSLARDHGARLIILHVWDRPAKAMIGDLLRDGGEEAAYAELQERLHGVVPSDANLIVDYKLMEGEPDSTIIQLANDEGVDLIVMGTHGRRGLSRILMGSVAESVVRFAACPVVTVKNPIPERAIQEQNVATEAANAPLQEMVTG